MKFSLEIPITSETKFDIKVSNIIIKIFSSEAISQTAIKESIVMEEKSFNMKNTIEYLKQITGAEYTEQELQNIKWLYLWGTKITDEGLKHIATLQNLERLDLWNTQ